MRPCPRQEVRELAQALGLSETTASVLVRRGYGDPEKAKAFLAAEPPEHDPRLLGDVRRGVRRSSTRRSPPAAASASTGTTTSTASVRPRSPSPRSAAWARRSTGTFRAASRRATACLARRWRGCAREEGAAPAHGRLRDHRGRGGRRGARRRPRGRRHRPPPARRALPDCPVVATRPSDYPFPELCGTGVVYKLARGARAPRASTATSTSSRSRRSPTWSRSWTRTARSSTAGLRQAGAHGQAGAAGAHARRAASTRPPSTPARSPSGSLRASTRPDASATRVRRSICSSPRTAARRTRSRASSRT